MLLTRSLVPRPEIVALTHDVGAWRLVYFREIGEAWWCVPGCRRLGQRIVVGKT